MTRARQLRGLGLGRRGREILPLVTLLAAICTGVGALRMAPVARAQSSRDAYREAFRTWRNTDPSLESDAARGGAGWAQRTETAAAAAARYAMARSAFLRSAAAEANQSMNWLRNARQLPQPEITPALDMQTLISSSTGLVSSQISTYADDPDPSLLPLRQALERERSALVALSSAISERQKASSKLVSADIAAEQARAQALQPYQSMASALADVSTGMDQESLAWAEYYRKLADSAQISGVVAAPAGNGEVHINNPARGGAAAGSPRINNPAGAAELSARVNNPPQTAPNPSAWSRYTGLWTFPLEGGLYHGPPPSTNELAVKEEGGQISGTMEAHFWPFGDIKTVSALHFEFSGMADSGRVQSFPLITSDGAKGKVDLIPGPAFNLLEVNFYTDRKPGKISQGNLLLIRK